MFKNNSLVFSDYMQARIKERAAADGVSDEEEAEALIYIALQEDPSAEEIQDAVLESGDEMIDYERRNE